MRRGGIKDWEIVALGAVGILLLIILAVTS